MRSERLRRMVGLLVVLTVSTIVHRWVLTSGHIHWTGDTESYLEPARAFLRTGSFTRVATMSYVDKEPADLQPAPDTIRTPGYPLFLALNGLDLERALLIQHVLDILLAPLIYLFASAALKPRAALIAALAYAMWFPMALITDTWMSESLFVLALALAIGFAYAAARGRSIVHALAAGLLLGAAVLIRPIALLFFVLVTLILAVYARRVAVVALFLAAALALPAAWSVRNYRATGVFTVSSIGAENELFFRAGSALVCDGDSLSAKVTVLHRQHGFFPRLFRAQPLLLEEAMAMARSDGIDPAHSSHAVRARYMARLATILIAPRIGTVAVQALGAVVELWITGLSTAAYELFDLYTARVIYIPLAVMLDVLALMGAAQLWRGNRPLFWLIAAVAVYFTVLSACPGDRLYRFFAPMAPAFAVAVGAGSERVIAAAGALRNRAPRRPSPR
jgi:hypothetical protein